MFVKIKYAVLFKVAFDVINLGQAWHRVLRLSTDGWLAADYIL